MLTVDTPVGGTRRRDVHNGLTIPPALSLRTFVDGALHPNWWFDLLTTEPLTFASLESTGGTVAELINRVFDPALTMADVEWLRVDVARKLVIKGIQSVDDARRVVDAGADAVLLSNHGGRQLDRAPVPLELVARRWSTSSATGPRSSSTPASPTAPTSWPRSRWGAGGPRRPRLPLRADGRRRARRVAKSVQILTGEMVRTMQLIGVNSVDELRPSHVAPSPERVTCSRVRAGAQRVHVAGMGFIDKAKELLGQHDDQVDQAIDKGGDTATEKFGHGEQIDKANRLSRASAPARGGHHAAPAAARCPG